MNVATWIVTGGSGFIGSAFVRLARARGWARIVNLDALTYAGNPENLACLMGDPGYEFVHGDICDAPLVARLFAAQRPAALVNFAAETHVDRSIHDAAPFLRTNILGTQTLLDAARAHLQGLDAAGRAAFRFLHVSTDEVYGTLGPDDPPFRETTPFAPNSPGPRIERSTCDSAAKCATTSTACSRRSFSTSTRSPMTPWTKTCRDSSGNPRKFSRLPA